MLICMPELHHATQHPCNVLYGVPGLGVHKFLTTADAPSVYGQSAKMGLPE